MKNQSNTPLRVGINALVLKNPLTGVAKRLISLYAPLPRLYPGSMITFFTPHTPSARNYQILQSQGIDFNQPEFKIVITPVAGLKIPVWREVAEWWWLHFRLPFLFRRHDIRIYEAPWGRGIPYFLPFLLSWVGIKKPVMIITVHDLIPLARLDDIISSPLIRFFNRGYLAFQRFFFKLRMTAELTAAAQVIAVSPQIRTDINSYFPVVDPEKISVLPNGVARMGKTNLDNRKAIKKDFSKKKGKKSIRLKSELVETSWDYLKKNAIPNHSGIKIPKKFLFYIGGFNHRKNLCFLLAALQKSKPDHALVLAGKENHYFRQILLPLIKKHPLPILRIGYLPEKYLPLFYREAVCVIYPSLAEGFGMPPLEALAEGGRVLIDKNLPINLGDEGKSFILSVLEKTYPRENIIGWWQRQVISVNGRDIEEMTSALNRLMSSQKRPNKSETIEKKIWGKHCPLAWENLAAEFGSWLSLWSKK